MLQPHSGAPAPQNSQNSPGDDLTPMQRLSAGLAESEAARSGGEVEREALALRFRENPQMEHLLILRETEPATYEHLAVGTRRMALATYERERAAFHRIGEFADQSTLA